MKMILWLSLILISACGKSSDNKKKVVEITPEQITNLLEKQSFTCESVDGKECPDALARLFILNPKEPTQSGLCSGFLTRSNRLITNAHCVPTIEECLQTYVVVHVQGDYRVARCQNILKVYQDHKPLPEKALDVAVLELDRHFKELQFFKSSTRRLNPGDTATAWVIDHLNLFEARITELECILKEKSHSYIYKNCAAIGGNSGSPITNEQGQVTSILWGSTTEDFVDELFPLNSRRLLENWTYATDVSLVRSSF
ncbi:MAG TPA: serine protease [Bacteriovoracaceae bacterium]|nr:serine protease [Bacteriovoracaceae bacterium]